MKTLMIDLETLDVADSAAIIQIGMVVFDGEFQPTSKFSVEIDFIDSIASGYTISEDTCKFWCRQDAKVRNSIIHSPNLVSCQDAAKRVMAFLKAEFPNNESFKIMSNHVLFDLPKLNNLLSDHGFLRITELTPYYLVEDYSSIRNITKDLYPKQYKIAVDAIPNAQAHDATSDCYYQLAILRACYEILGEHKPTYIQTEGNPNHTIEPYLSPEYDHLLNPPEMKDDLPSWEDDPVVNYDDPFSRFIL